MKTHITQSIAKKHLAILTIIILLSGCATVHDMGVNKSTEKLNLDGNGLLLMSLEISNLYKPDYQPQILVTHLETPGADSKEDRHNFKTDLDGTVSSSAGTRYLLRMKIPPGKYVVRGATCMYRSLFLASSCLLPIHADIEVKGDTTTYLGRVSGTMRERKEGELRSGPVIPLIDQAVTGFATSTFDVVISDAWEEDVKSYSTLFPALAQAEIAKNIMPKFDKQRAYIWWESNGGSEANSPSNKSE